jgi:hypothetical protein
MSVRISFSSSVDFPTPAHLADRTHEIRKLFLSDSRAFGIAVQHPADRTFRLPFSRGVEGDGRL